MKDTKSSGRTRSATAPGDAAGIGFKTGVSSSMVGVISAAFVFSSSISTQGMHCAAVDACDSYDSGDARP